LEILVEQVVEAIGDRKEQRSCGFVDLDARREPAAA